ncbi:MAG: hypothetical protein JO145_14755, partial [Acidobacteriaceae bacterium]|nr:hypothetical protein [Acidobacteriaceae bacterium]
NSAYIAHLGVIDRETALNLNVYSDPDTEGSADWDLFVRFLLAGHSAAHIPEVVYSWRMHASSTAEDALHKPYIHNSQRAVLQRYLDGSSHSDDYSVEYSPLLPGSADWWLRPRRNKARPLLIAVLTHSDAPKPGQKPKFSFDYPDVRWEFVSIHSHPHSLDGLCETLSDPDGFICFLAQDIESIDCSDWVWEAIGLAELHPETVMVGGRIRNKKRIITAAGFQFGFDGPCGCPDRGRSAIDRGYFAQMFKERSVSAVSTQFAVIRADFLCDLLRNGLAPQSSIPFLGAWAGAYALRTGKRVVYSPFLSAVSDVDWETLSGPEEKQAFLGRNRDLIPDRRFYPRYFSLHGTEAYQIA